ncbi:competence/damage-inducible protein A [Thermosipho ferrireducens]|uniref:CinA-like protein n=1 Tax=Thermosipho ferrireducens TaxID=2571116 RepID=A0ABX7S980_9BACT|nr:competence/damage-inducible protein A [Thermosipho ferrireducens]QTA38819.1 competence/damage-inducible protein A [Thermosipho ferrireducens]
MKKAIILAVGNELVQGLIVDTNSKYISRELFNVGYETLLIKSVPDDFDLLVYELKDSISRSDLVITIGGLGPTEDDLTREAVAEALNKKLVFSKNLSESIIKKAKAFYENVPEIINRQAYVIEGAEIIENPVGTAPGQFLNISGKHIILLPGPPSELIPMFKKAIENLRELPGFYMRRVKTVGIPEVVLVDEYKHIIYSNKNVNVATMASHKSGVELRFTGPVELKDVIDNIVKELTLAIKDNIYAYDDSTIEEVVYKQLLESNMTVSFAESCTGGLLSSEFVKIPGVSSVFKGGIIAYSNEVKINLLGVRLKTIKNYGAVSRECVEEMSKGVAELLRSDFGVAISGVAGPSGGTPQKPVGTVWICIYNVRNDVHYSQKYNFRGDRNMIRSRSVLQAFDMLRRALR